MRLPEDMTHDELREECRLLRNIVSELRHINFHHMCELAKYHWVYADSKRYQLWLEERSMLK